MPSASTSRRDRFDCLECMKITLALLHELRDELAALKSEALARFTEGELSGHELMQGFLVQVNDVRDYIQGLIRRLEDRHIAA